MMKVRPESGNFTSAARRMVADVARGVWFALSESDSERNHHVVLPRTHRPDAPLGALRDMEALVRDLSGEDVLSALYQSNPDPRENLEDLISDSVSRAGEAPAFVVVDVELFADSLRSLHPLEPVEAPSEVQPLFDAIAARFADGTYPRSQPLSIAEWEERAKTARAAGEKSAKARHGVGSSAPIDH